MKLENVEKVEKILFQGSNFSIKNVVITGSKNKAGGKLNPIYDRSYASTKYTDRNSLTQITIRTSDFLVFAYNNFDVNQRENTNIEIYCSYPHLSALTSFFEEVINTLTIKDLFTSNGVNPKYKDDYIESDVLGGGKTLKAMPELIESEDGNVKHPGILLFFNDDDKYSLLDEKAIEMIYNLVSRIDLLSISNQTLILGFLYDTLNGNQTNSFASNNTNSNSNNNSGRRGLFKGGKSFGSKNNGTRSSFGSHTSNEEQQDSTVEEVSDEELNQNFENNNETEESGLSMSNILNEAENIDFDLEEGETEEF